MNQKTSTAMDAFSRVGSSLQKRSLPTTVATADYLPTNIDEYLCKVKKRKAPQLRDFSFRLSLVLSRLHYKAGDLGVGPYAMGNNLASPLEISSPPPEQVALS